MEHHRRMARMSQGEDIIEFQPGKPPALTVESDDDEYDLCEISAPVPYQKGYWLAAKNQQKRKQRQQQKSQTNQNSNANTKPMKQQSQSQPQSQSVHQTTSNSNT